MEEKLITDDVNHDFAEVVRRGLSLDTMDAGGYSPLTLAYIGDDVYDLVIRTYILSMGNMPVNKLDRIARELVKAGTQSAMMSVLEPVLSDEEMSVYKRGRNAKSHTKAKNATIIDYRRATGFEALIGFLYLKGDYARMVELIREGLSGVNGSGSSLLCKEGKKGG